MRASTIDAAFVECEKFTGRMRQICRGEANLPLNGPHSTNSYRVKQMKLLPLPQDAATVNIGVAPSTNTRIQPSRPLYNSNVGTNLAALLKAVKVPVKEGCNCEWWIARMNNWTIAENKEHKQEIIDHLKQQAVEAKMSVVETMRTGFLLTLNGVMPSVQNLVDEAIRQAEKAVADKTPRFITAAQLMADAHALASKLPPDTSCIIGIARSGLSAATQVAMLLHLPLKIFRQSTYDMVDGGNGWRLTGNVGGTGRPVVIDDTVMTGNSTEHCMAVIRKTHPDAISAAVYVNPEAKVKPDMWAVDLPWPHVLSWNIFNSVLTPSCAFDFDGILCHDCAPEDDDDGLRYAEFLSSVPPLYPVRRVPIPLIVTARLEKYRTQTLAWLAKHRINVDTLVMGSWSSLTERRQSDIAAFKAEHFKKFLKKQHRVKPAMFIESDAAQAERIARLSGGLVVCPTAGRCYQ